MVLFADDHVFVTVGEELLRAGVAALAVFVPVEIWLLRR
jgi:hypothetical protein